MRYIKAFAWLVGSFLPLLAHYQWWSPWLLAHGSSAAFEACISLWVVSIGLFLVGLIYAGTELK